MIGNTECQVHILGQWEDQTTHIKFIRCKINLNISSYSEPCDNGFWCVSETHRCTWVCLVDSVPVELPKNTRIPVELPKNTLIRISYRFTPNFSTKPPTSGLKNSDKLSILFTYSLCELSKVTCFYLTQDLWRFIYSLK